jgi:hypothetical protein
MRCGLEIQDKEIKSQSLLLNTRDNITTGLSCNGCIPVRCTMKCLDSECWAISPEDTGMNLSMSLILLFFGVIVLVALVEM